MYFLYQKPCYVNTLVIGAGPTGLATSYLLAQQNIQHLILEQSDRVASSWYGLWDSYQLAMPAKWVEMPGTDLAKLYGEDSHPTRDQLISFFNEYAKHYQLPIIYRAKVKKVSKMGDRFEVLTHAMTYICHNVVCCIGPRQFPCVPLDFQRLRSRGNITVLHSSSYRSPFQFDAYSRVLVIGSGVSALCIAKDIHRSSCKISIACAYSSDEIKKRNPHVYAHSNPEIIPSLEDIEELGITNYGRFLSSSDFNLTFTKDNQVSTIDIGEFDVIIFATGFGRSFQILKDLLDADPMATHQESGIYIAGIPKHNQPTVLISEGTEDAKQIVQSIASRSVEWISELSDERKRFLAKL